VKKKLSDLLKRHFPKATEVEVEDTSGGCGSFYRIRIVSIDFNGKSLLQQHKLVNQALGDEVKKFHGLNIQTVAKK